MDTPRPDHEVSSGNVFADLGLPDSYGLRAKAALAQQIANVAAERRLTQAETARLLGTTQPKVSDLFAGNLAGFSMDRLIRFLNALDRDVQIVVTPKGHGRSRATTQVVGTPAQGSRGSETACSRGRLVEVRNSRVRLAARMRFSEFLRCDPCLWVA